MYVYMCDLSSSCFVLRACSQLQSDDDRRSLTT
jgi:hypothetical protein